MGPRDRCSRSGAAVVAAVVLLTGSAPSAAAVVEAGGGGNRPSSPPALARAVAIEATGPVQYALPVDGPVLRPFDAPATYGPGHRGVDLYAPAGAVVRAAADGTVTFAGSVAGVAWVTIRHADGVRTSYGHLGAVVVEVGDRVQSGTPVGTAAGELSSGRPHVHLGARDEDGHFDPMLLFRLPIVRVRLDRPGAGRIVVRR